MRILITEIKNCVDCHARKGTAVRPDWNRCIFLDKEIIDMGKKIKDPDGGLFPEKCPLERIEK